MVLSVVGSLIALCQIRPRIIAVGTSEMMMEPTRSARLMLRGGLGTRLWSLCSSIKARPERPFSLLWVPGAKGSALASGSSAFRPLDAAADRAVPPILPIVIGHAFLESRPRPTKPSYASHKKRVRDGGTPQLQIVRLVSLKAEQGNFWAIRASNSGTKINCGGGFQNP